MAVHTMTTEKIARLHNIARNSGINFEDLIKKELKADGVIVSEMGGVWLGNEEEGRMLSPEELIELGNRLAEILE